MKNRRLKEGDAVEVIDTMRGGNVKLILDAKNWRMDEPGKGEDTHTFL